MKKEQPTKPECPVCGSKQVYYRIKLNQYQCRVCGNSWEARWAKLKGGLMKTVLFAVLALSFVGCNRLTEDDSDATSGAVSQNQDFDGAWSGLVQSSSQTTPIAIYFDQNGQIFTGNIQGIGSSIVNFNGTVDSSDNLLFAFPDVLLCGQNPSGSAQVEGDSMSISLIGPDGCANAWDIQGVIGRGRF